MCLNHNTIYTNAHHLSRSGYQPYKINVKCNNCPECWQENQDEYCLRTYYEMRRCLKDGGYIIWDCLTYNEANVPWLSKIESHVPKKYDFRCFNWRDIQLFIKRIKEECGRKIQYMIAGEYGQKEGRTHRSHYHMLLFVNEPISPEDMSMTIRRQWGKGTTAGLEDKGRDYFYTMGLITPDSKEERIIKASEYICKYCSKNADFDKIAFRNTELLTEFYYMKEKQYQDVTYKDIQSNPEWRKRRNRIYQNVKCRQIHGNHYGEYFLESAGLQRQKWTWEGKPNKDLINNNMISMPNKQKVKFWQKIPQYYIRKMYYNYKRLNGQIYWELTDIGLEWKQSRIERSINNYAKRLREKETYAQSSEFQWLVNYENSKRGVTTNDYYNINDLLYAYKADRTWEEIAEYYIFYKDRVGGEKLLTPEEICKKNKEDSPWKLRKSHNIDYNYCHRTDMDNFGHQLISYRNLGDKNGYKHTRGDELKPKQFLERYCINENWRENWNDLDKLWDILCRIDYYINYNNTKVWKTKKRAAEQKTLFNT